MINNKSVSKEEGFNKLSLTIEQLIAMLSPKVLL